MSSADLVTARPRSSEAPHPWLDRSLYPFPTRSFRTRDGALSFVDQGHGSPVVFVHGTPSWSFEWRAVIAALGPSRRAIAPDHLGFGLSEKPADAPYRPEDHARRLLALFDHLDLDDVTLVVHDFGGPIGLPIALERTERVRRVVVVNSWMWPLGDDPRAARASRVVRGPLGKFLYRTLNASARFLIPASFADRSRLPRRVHRQYIGPLARRRDRLAPWVLGCELTGSDDYYGRLWARRGTLASLPMTVLWGERDRFLDRRQRDRWLAAFPGARVVSASESGHFPQEEEPALVAAAVAEELLA
jgi:haloalkane dehalogenase